mgnify:CR=1 FL=1
MLKANLTTLDGLDDSLKALYKEAGEGFALQVSGMVASSEVDVLKQGLVDAKEAFTDLKSKNAAVTEKLVRKEKALERAEAGNKGDDGHEAIIAQLKADHQAELDAANGLVSGLRMDNLTSTFQSELAEAGFHPQVIADIAAGAQNRVTLDAEGKQRILSLQGTPQAGSGADGYATLGDLAKELAEAKPDFLADLGKGGGGKPPASQSGNNNSPKNISRAAFDDMSQNERSTFSINGGKVTD